MLLLYVFILLSGFVIGSFLTALTYRVPRELSIAKGRSFCPHCKHVISWYDNIPVVSYLLLGGKCRHCKKSISIRYPLIEAITGLSFLLIYLYFERIYITLPYLHGLNVASYLFVFFLAATSIGIAVIDLEHQIIPDGFVWTAFILSLIVFALSSGSDFYVRLLCGFGCSLFLLILNLMTKGRGMGLGDVKLAIPLGFVLGFPYAIVFMFVSFIFGAIVGVVLLALGKANMKARIAFGPFMLIGFWITLFAGHLLINLVMPYYIY